MEPQRTALEKILLPQVKDLPGRKVVLLGKPAENREAEPGDDTIVYSYRSFAGKSRTDVGIPVHNLPFRIYNNDGPRRDWA